MLEGRYVAAIGSGAVRTAEYGLGGTPSRCEVCGAVLQGRQSVACSAKCRAIRWRRRGEATQRAEVESLCQAVGLLRVSVDALAERVDRMTQRSAPRRES